MNMVGLRDVLVVAPPSSFPFHHHHHHQHLHLGAPEQQPVIPLLVDDHARNLHIWQQQQQQPQQNPPLAKASNLRKPMLDAAAACTDVFNAACASGGGIVVGASSSSTTTCQDCGNQAKKDCAHRRCRTCCKGRGFDCPTHIKSTWVPAARRRERQHQLAAAGSTSASTSGSKKPRLVVGSASNTTTSTSNNTPPLTSLDTSSCHQDAGFKENLPKNVRAPAVFKCVRVTSIDDDGEDEYAYHAMVKIGGHVFKGFLYDQGVEVDVDGGNNNNNDATTHSSSRNQNNESNSGATPNLSVLHLGSGGDVIGGGGGHSDMYVGGVPSNISPT